MERYVVVKVIEEKVVTRTIHYQLERSDQYVKERRTSFTTARLLLF